jgi:hypothetical protein
MDLTPGAKVWFVDNGDFYKIKQGTLVEKYYIGGGTQPWWALKLSRKGTQPHKVRHKPEHHLYPTRKVARAAFRMGL